MFLMSAFQLYKQTWWTLVSFKWRNNLQVVVLIIFAEGEFVTACIYVCVFLCDTWEPFWVKTLQSEDTLAKWGHFVQSLLFQGLFEEVS